MKIAHASLPADNPKRVVEVLADIMQGEAMAFPPGGCDSWMAWSGDGAIELEIVPRGHVLRHGDAEGEWRGQADAVGRHSEAHLAICVDRPAEEVIAIAVAAGWPARRCDRGEGLFQLCEVWVEGAFMLEFLDPSQAARYHDVITPANWKRFLAMMAGDAATAGDRPAA
ncbi:MAG: hypothetical protein EP321_05640 [Sphingomonadales bacterium]|nr:MAG: hypothetical protein EP345_01330 [Sphingomonadales bacterium]TNF04871.1 MAG: hypothetical protein EP321_05640 [Sphingomonadales bacterium]